MICFALPYRQADDMALIFMKLWQVWASLFYNWQMCLYTVVEHGCTTQHSNFELVQVRIKVWKKKNSTWIENKILINGIIAQTAYQANKTGHNSEPRISDAPAQHRYTHTFAQCQLFMVSLPRTWTLVNISCKLFVPCNSFDLSLTLAPSKEGPCQLDSYPRPSQSVKLWATEGIWGLIPFAVAGMHSTALLMQSKPLRPLWNSSGWWLP